MGWLPRTLVFAGVLLPIGAAAQTAAPPDTFLYIIYPRDGMKVRSPITVRFGLRGMGVTHAGDATPNLGHHHLFVDVTEPLKESEPMPSDKKHLHFGAGQTETKLELPPGKHTLQLVLGDAEHKPFNPVVASKTVTITVSAPKVPRTSAR